MLIGLEKMKLSLRWPFITRLDFPRKTGSGRKVESQMFDEWVKEIGSSNSDKKETVQ